MREGEDAEQRERRQTGIDTDSVEKLSLLGPYRQSAGAGACRLVAGDGAGLMSGKKKPRAVPSSVPVPEVPERAVAIAGAGTGLMSGKKKPRAIPSPSTVPPGR